METFTDVLNLWPEGALIEDLGIKAGRLAIWRHRDVIPLKEFPNVVASAKKRRIKGVTLELLHSLEAGKARRAA